MEIEPSGRGSVGGVLGIGVDLAEVSRFRGLDRRTVEHFLTPGEVEDAFAREEPAQTLAGRFAAKEAVIKALGVALPGRRVFYNDVVIDHIGSGAPRASITGLDAGNIQILLSISHTPELAIAFVMAVQKDDRHGRCPASHPEGDILRGAEPGGQGPRGLDRLQCP